MSRRDAPHAGNEGARRHLPVFRHRGVGGGARQHPVAGGPGARLRDRPLRAPLGGGGPAPRPRGGDDRGGLALGSRRGGHRGGPLPGCGRPPIDPGRRGAPQRDLDGRRERRAGRAAGPRCLRPPRTPPRGHHLLPRLHALRARPVGGGRDRRGLAEGAHASTRARLQRGEREGVARRRGCEARAELLGLAGDGGSERGRLLPVHPGDEPPLRPQGSRRHAGGGGDGAGLRPSPAVRGGDAAGGAGVGPRLQLPTTRASERVPHCGSDAGRLERRRAPRPHPGALRRLPRQRAREAR